MSIIGIGEERDMNYNYQERDWDKIIHKMRVFKIVLGINKMGE